MYEEYKVNRDTLYSIFEGFSNFAKIRVDSFSQTA